MNKMRISIKGIEIIKRKQMVILELNSTRTEMKKKLRRQAHLRFEQAEE